METNDYDLREIWNQLSSPIHGVYNECGDNMENAQVRRFWGDYCIYVDDVDGFSVMRADDPAFGGVSVCDSTQVAWHESESDHAAAYQAEDGA